MFEHGVTFLRKAPAWSIWRRFSYSSRPRSPWGDGLVDQSLSTTWYPVSWDDVSDDELVFFLPSLAFSRTAIGGRLSERGCRFIRDALCRRTADFADAAAAALGRPQVADASARDSDVLGLIARSGALTSLPADEAVREGRALRADHGTPAHGRKLSEQAVIEELAALACIDRMHFDASGADACAADGGACTAGAGVSFEVALLASIHAQFNAAYLYPHYDWGHESFAAGAWLGTLMSGRAALMPPFIAEILLDVCPAPEPGKAAACQSARIFAYSMERAGGYRRLRRIARRVVATGISAVVAAPGRLSQEAADADFELRDAIMGRLKSAPLLERMRTL